MSDPAPTSTVHDATPAQAAGAFPLLRSLNRLRRAGGALLTQASLHGQLASVEWQQEKQRLLAMLATLILGTASMLCVMLFTGLLVLLLAWSTPYRIVAVVAVIAAYAIATLLAWRKLQALSALGEHSFAATREELAADLAELRSAL